MGEKTEKMRRYEEEEARQLEVDRLGVEEQREQVNSSRHQLEQEVQAWSSLKNLTYRSVLQGTSIRGQFLKNLTYRSVLQGTSIRGQFLKNLTYRSVLQGTSIRRQFLKNLT